MYASLNHGVKFVDSNGYNLIHICMIEFIAMQMNKVINRSSMHKTLGKGEGKPPLTEKVLSP